VNEGQAVDLIEETIRHVRAAGSTKLLSTLYGLVPGELRLRAR
jgi:hypothetical protein